MRPVMERRQTVGYKICLALYVFFHCLYSQIKYFAINIVQRPAFPQVTLLPNRLKVGVPLCSSEEKF